MDANRFEAVSKFFAGRRLSRRQALAGTGAGIAAGALGLGLAKSANAQEATPIAPDADHGPATLFLQSFQQGSVAPKDGAADTYTLTLEHGLGQTIYFSDRPERTVGATPTDQFVQSFGFPTNDPPNAALLVDSGNGETDIVVVELFNPSYDTTTNTATYDVKALADWEKSSEVALQEEPADLSLLAASFGSAHLFIDDCLSGDMPCITDMNNPSNTTVGYIPDSAHDGFCYNWGAAGCYPCSPWYSGYSGDASAFDYWSDQCNQIVPGCTGQCFVEWVCTSGLSSHCQSTFGG
jgi:hypothetical protein